MHVKKIKVFRLREFIMYMYLDEEFSDILSFRFQGQDNVDVKKVIFFNKLDERLSFKPVGIYTYKTCCGEKPSVLIIASIFLLYLSFL